MGNDAVDTLVYGLHDDRDGLRQFVMRRLVNLGPQVVPAVIGLLGDNKDYTQESAAIILAAFGSDSLPHLLDALKTHPDRRVRWGAAWVLATMGPEARNVVPHVTVVAAEAAAKPAPRRQPSDLWSDAWLTKIRDQLAAARQLDFNLGGA